MNPPCLSRAVVACSAFILYLAVIAPGVFAQATGKVLATGLNGPMGVLVADDGNVWVVDTGVGGDSEMQFPHPMTGAMTTVKYGNTARILKVDASGNQTEIAKLPSVFVGPGEAFGGGRLAILDGTLYVTSGTWRIEAGEEPVAGMSSVMKIADGVAHEVANTFDVEKASNPDGNLIDSNPFGLVAGPDGNLWVSDAAGNTLLTVHPKSGDIKVVALFDLLPSPMPNPEHENRMETDPVPTGIAFDRNGQVYVALLSGFPFVPGSAKVVTVDSDGNISDYATGMTMLVDLQTGPDGELYAVTFGQFTERGPQPNSGSLWRVRKGDKSEAIASGLSFPTSIGFNAAGDAYVTTNGVGEPGSGEIVVFTGLAAAGK